MKNYIQNFIENVKDKFRFGTLSFIFIIAYVNIFQHIFGPENSIVGVIFTIMMSASMVRDLTATPVRHLILQSAVLVWIALAACWVVYLPMPLSLVINFITLFMILYAFTYEYSTHMYFPYILSYLFLIFITPVDAAHLPKRLVGMLVGALSIILYQWVMGRKRVAETAQDVLTEMIDDISGYIAWLLLESPDKPDLSDIRHKLCSLSQIVYDRRKKALCISDAGFCMVEAGRGLEHLLAYLQEIPRKTVHSEKNLLQYIQSQLKMYRAYINAETADLRPPAAPVLSGIHATETAGRVGEHLTFIYQKLLHMSDPEKKLHYRKTALSLKIQLQMALDWSPVRGIYALRVAMILTCATALVQYLALPHGKWLLFTPASVSLPYADDVPQKMRKRIIATIAGGLISVVIYSLVPSPVGRTVAMMLSGYLSFFFADYTETYACSTIGALGGAVFMNAFGFQAVTEMFLVRFSYILVGAAAAYVLNYMMFPYSRDRATRALWKKYQSNMELLDKIKHTEKPDSQLYYTLVILTHLQEDKLIRNAEEDHKNHGSSGSMRWNLVKSSDA